MDVGILCASSDTSGEIQDMYDAFEKSGHNVFYLDVNDARWDTKKQNIIYSNLKPNASMDCFLDWNSYDDHGMREDDPNLPRAIPFHTQLNWLSLGYQTPVPYSAEQITCDKVKMSEMFNAVAGLPVPLSYDGSNVLARRKALDDMKGNGHIFVLKPAYGWGGTGIVKVSTPQSLGKAFKKFDRQGENFLIQEFIECSGIDYRAYVIDDKVVGMIKRTPKPGEWRGNFGLGATPEAYTLSPKAQNDAIRAMEAAKLKFGVVDLLIDPKTGQHYICEINDCAGTTSIEMCHPDLCIADEIVQMCEKHYAPNN